MNQRQMQDNDEMYEQDNNSGYLAPTPPQMHDPMMSSENLRYMLDANPMIDDVERILRGMEYNKEKKVYEQKYKVLANEDGIRTILWFLKLADKDIKVSNFDPEIVKNTMRSFNNNISCTIHLRCEEFGINDLDCDYIIDFLFNLVYAAYCRGQEAHEKRFLRAAQFGMLATPYMNPAFVEPQKNKGFLQRFNPFAK